MIILALEKTAEIINHYNELIGITQASDDDNFFVSQLEMFLAQALLQDLRSNSCRKLGNILISISDLKGNPKYMGNYM